MNRVLRMGVLLVLLIAAVTAGIFSAADKTYVILAKSQGKGSADIDDLVSAAGGTIQAKLEEVGIIVALSANPQFLDIILADPRISKAAEDREVNWIPNETAVEAEVSDATAQGVNSEPGWPLQWNIRQIHADQTAAAGYQGEGAYVAVLDSGIWSKHPDISPNLDLKRSKSFVPGEPGIEPIVYGFSHGTHVAGIIAAPINDIGIQGVAPKAKILAVKVLRSDTGEGAFSWIIQGIMYAVLKGVDVINLSLGATFDRNDAGGIGVLNSALNRTINHATSEGMLVVSSAGNEGLDLNSGVWSIPAQSGNGMAVSATAPINQKDFDTPASYTNYGQSVISVAAPGGDLVPGGVLPDLIVSPASKEADGSYGYYFAGGTSMAAPHVSGLAALMVGKYGHIGTKHLRQLIEQTADDILKPGADEYSGKGRINALQALAK